MLVLDKKKLIRNRKEKFRILTDADLFGFV